jgi:purine nucleosidase
LIKIHLDTDLGGDIDDLCALAMLLRRPEVEVVGVTTAGDDNGRRAGYVRYVLQLAGRGAIPVAAGADVSSGVYRTPLGLPVESDYWPEPVPPYPTPASDALDLLEHSLEAGATLVCIGPLTNLRLLDERRPGILQTADLYLMGGYVYPPRPGFPAWGNDMDFNLQADVVSAAHVFVNARPTLVPLSMSVETALRRAHLESLSRPGLWRGSSRARPKLSRETRTWRRASARPAPAYRRTSSTSSMTRSPPLSPLAGARGWR